MSQIQELIVDAYGCQENLSDHVALEKAARRAVELVGAQIAEVTHHRFQPHGLTLCLILKESHFIVSTWPEFDFAVVNVFLCNPSMDAKKCWEAFATALGPTDCTFHTVRHEIGKQRKAA